MKKALFLVVMSVVLMLALLVAAFLYIDFSGHKYYSYGIFEMGLSSGSMAIDHYVTEEKIIYKGTSEYSGGIGYSNIKQKLFLDKKTNTPRKFEEKAIGNNDASRLVLLVQDGESADYLFLDEPIYFAIKGLSTGESTMIFSPDNLMLYLPIMEKYNYWKKGAQFFEVAIPVELPMPPMRDKVAVTYLKDEYITIMGTKIEAESFTFSSGAIPEAVIYMGKYSHRPLKLEVPEKQLEFMLEGFIDTPWKRMAGGMKTLRRTVDEVRSRAQQTRESGDGSVLGEESVRDAAEEVAIKEIFFENDDVIFQGWLYSPEKEEDSYPLLVMVQDDGAMTNGESSMMERLAVELAVEGTVSLIFKDSGQRVTSGRYTARNDAERISNVKAAVKFLSGKFSDEISSITLLGYKGGGYIALKSAEEIPEITSCVLLGIPSSFIQETASGEASPDDIQSMLSLFGLGPFDDSYMRTVSVELLRHDAAAEEYQENAFFRDGIKLPVEDFRVFLRRDPYFLAERFERPLLFIYGRNDVDFNQKVIEKFNRNISSNKGVKIASFRELGPYMADRSVKDGKVNFRLNDDVRDLVIKWMRKGPVPEVLPRNSENTGL